MEAQILTATTQTTDDLDALISALPKRVQTPLRSHSRIEELLEVVMDLGRPPEARFRDEQVILDWAEVTDAELEGVIESVGEFGDDNRAGIERTLHRISVIRNRHGNPVGLTCRVGRAVYGTVKIIEDLVRDGQSVLMLGRPGVGKTTMLREVARVLADDLSKRVVIVDTSNEIAGDGDVPHPAIGRARRMQVTSTSLQHQVMIEAVENHMPEVIIIDEMSTEAEAMAAATIAERGVQLIATAHGNTLANLVSNPALSDLVGGTQSVTLGDVEARRRGSQKTVLERRHKPTFEVVVEIQDYQHVGLHRNVGLVVDRMLRGFPVEPEIRTLEEGEVKVLRQAPAEWQESLRGVSTERPAPDRGSGRPGRKGREGRETAVRNMDEAEEPAAEPPRTSVYVFGVPRTNLQSVARSAGALLNVVDSPDEADLFLTTKAHYNRRPTAVRAAEQRGLPVYVLRKASSEQIRQFVKRFDSQKAEANGHGEGSGNGAVRSGRKPREQDMDDTVRSALLEAEEASQRILSGEHRIDLSPQPAFIRRLQHGVGNRYNIGSSSTGQDPHRHVVLRQRRS